ncbi:hypothetical protein BS50DRAFT_375874 [Corynespora cassiicola Philippines]|uniref:Uncharacterized protein n=1 Tax=Corynespora cassiicola Philippines TaxID=1448308 RepID=A0A2T2NN62_CORCC|nr:hypothetical protein BS50DRAFT_375874 [Corynespora cassiicola Philippines]
MISTTPIDLTSRPSDSLTTGEKAGIGVGASVGALALVLGTYLIGEKLKRRKRSDGENSGYTEKPEMDGTGIHKCEEIFEACGGQAEVLELPDTQLPREICSRAVEVPHELPDSQH